MLSAMSLSKLQHFVEKPLPTRANHSQISVPILISDSKGRYLERNFTRDSLVNLKFNCVSGRTTKQGIDILERDLPSYLEQFSSVIIYVWLGTCDVTDKIGNFIYAKPEQSQPVNFILSQYSRAINIVNSYENCRIKFIEVPPISITDFNCTRTGCNSDEYRLQDRLVHRYISELNREIKLLNLTVNESTLGFSNDVIRFRKGRNRKQRQSINLHLLLDGVHPISVLAKCWLHPFDI